jgi:hypothetical protein
MCAISGRYLLLDFDTATDRAVDAVECNKQRIAAGLNHAPTMLVDCRIDNAAPKLAQP